MLRSIFHICLLASFLLPPFSSALPAGFFTGDRPPVSHHAAPVSETTSSPTATPNARIPNPNVPTATPNAPTTTPNAPVPNPNVPTATSNDPAINLNVLTPTPNGPITNPNAPTANPNIPVTNPNAPTATPNVPSINPNAPTPTSNTPVTNPNVRTATPNAPTISPNPPTATPNTPVATPIAPVATPIAPVAAPNDPTVPRPRHTREPKPSPTSSMTWWCNKTPHPNPCNYYFQKTQNRPPRFRSEFLRMLIKTALDQGVIIHSQTKKFGPNCTNNQKKAAWSDCVKLLANTVSQLNRTLIGLNPSAPNDLKCTDFDAQTWLSTAQTNIDTCRLGSEDLNVSDFVLPAISNKNLSDLIGNCLAVNGVLMKQHNHTTANHKEYFPSWISRHERRLLLSTLARSKPNLVVALDRSGHFRSIQAAINFAARRRIKSRFIIYIKKGVYRENIEVGNDNHNIMLVGDGARRTIITSARSVKQGYTTYNSATAGFGGQRFVAKDMTFINTAGPLGGQAVAVRSSSDLSVFYRVGIHGFQDTLYIHSQRQFFRECYISGTIDFIFGNAAVVFQNCMILVRRPRHGQANVITAQARGDPFQNTGITIHSSRIIAASDLRPVVRAYKTYLGRPWQAYSRVTILKSYIDNSISPLGWSPWLRGSNFALNTVFYGEYKNFGPGSSTRWRVRWKGFHAINSAVVASRFTVGSLIAGGSWLPATGVPFKSGL